MTNSTGSRYSIRLARDTDVPALLAIEHAAVQLFIGYAPDSVREDATDERTFLHAIEKELLWVAVSDITPVGFAHVEMLAGDLPHLEELDAHLGRRRLGGEVGQVDVGVVTDDLAGPRGAEP